MSATPAVLQGRLATASGILVAAVAPHVMTLVAMSVRRSSGGQHEYVRQLWTRDGDADKNANLWGTDRSRSAVALIGCAGLPATRSWHSGMKR
jgi:lactate dehydrogenase-like 2-hydroxyacid dehydrogenase